MFGSPARRGVDLSEVQINRARGLVPEATFLHADATKVAFADRTFDAVVCLYALIHMPREAQPHLLGASRSGCRQAESF